MFCGFAPFPARFHSAKGNNILDKKNEGEKMTIATLCLPATDDNFLDYRPFPWNTGAPILWNPWDMIIHPCHDFYKVCADLSDSAEKLERIVPADTLINPGNSWAVKSSMEAAYKLVVSMGITAGAFHKDVSEVWRDVDAASDKFWGEAVGLHADVLARDLRRIRLGILTELQTYKFVYVPPVAARFFEQDRLFGEDVYDKFQSARFEIKEAGNALAVGMHTACVFHLMRVAEVGLRALAHDRRISKLPRKKNAPVDMGTWEDILKELDDEIAKITQWPNKMGAVKTQALEFYNSAITEFRGFKDAWRNHVMHTRREYLKEDALGVMEHVKRLMITLSSRISENDRTPLVWRKAQLKSKSQ
jgi:hypothetical protein